MQPSPSSLYSQRALVAALPRKLETKNKKMFANGKLSRMGLATVLREAIHGENPVKVGIIPTRLTSPSLPPKVGNAN